MAQITIYSHHVNLVKRDQIYPLYMDGVFPLLIQKHLMQLRYLLALYAAFCCFLAQVFYPLRYYSGRVS